MTDAQGRTLYIELAGLPGVGKSAVCERVIERLNDLGYRCGIQSRVGRRVRAPDGIQDHGLSWRHRSRGRRIIGYIRLHFRERHIALPLLRIAFSRPFDLHQALRRNRRLLLYIRKANNAIEIARRGESDLVIFDQGILPCIREFSAATRVTGAVHLSRIVDPAIDAITGARFVIIRLHADVPTIVERIRSRPRDLGPYDRMDPVEAERRLTNQQAYIDTIFEYLRMTSIRDDIEEIDARRPIDEVVERVVAVIVKRVGETGQEGQESDPVAVVTDVGPLDTFPVEDRSVGP